MFEISWSEFLIVAIVALIFIGPKELPAFFNTLGRYAGMVRRQAAEFRSYFEAAMREAEIDKLGSEFDVVRENVTASMLEIEASAKVEATRVSSESAAAVGEAKIEVDAAVAEKPAALEANKAGG